MTARLAPGGPIGAGSAAPREDFIDWMKTLGIFLIVYGHVAGWTINHATPPIYPKQLGVALFIFVAGFSLARERRAPLHAVFNRLFEVFVVGVPCALLLSAIGAASGTSLQLSNFFPFVFGANLLFDNFPANPTTWYIGTYIHLLIAWAVALRRLTVTPLLIASWLIVEIAARAWLAQAAGGFIAYMALSNWLTVFFVGMLVGRRGESPQRSGNALLALLLLVVSVLAWATVTARFAFDRAFPFRDSTIGSGLGEALALSAAITVLYAGGAWLVFDVTRRVAAPEAVRFFSRNTLIVFILHMPLFYLLEWQLASWTPSARSVASFVSCFLVLAWVGELYHRAVPMKELRDRVAARLTRADRGLPVPGARART